MKFASAALIISGLAVGALAAPAEAAHAINARHEAAVAAQANWAAVDAMAEDPTDAVKQAAGAANPKAALDKVKGTAAGATKAVPKPKKEEGGDKSGDDKKEDDDKGEENKGGDEETEKPKKKKKGLLGGEGLLGLGGGLLGL